MNKMMNQKVLYGVAIVLVLLIIGALSAVFYHVGKNKGEDSCPSMSGSGAVQPVEKFNVDFYMVDNKDNLKGANFNDVRLTVYVLNIGDNTYLGVDDISQTLKTNITSTSGANKNLTPSIGNVFQFNNVTNPVTKLVSRPNSSLARKLGKAITTTVDYNYCGLITLPVSLKVDSTGVMTIESVDSWVTAGSTGGIYGTAVQATNALAGSTCRTGENIQNNGFQGAGILVKIN